MRSARQVAALFAREALARGEAVRVTCRGRSMEPTLRDGDEVDVTPGHPLLGEVALLRLGDELVLHRVIARVAVGRADASLLVHCGDAGWRTAGVAIDADWLGRVPAIPRRSPRVDRAARWAVAAIALARYGVRVARSTLRR